MNGNRLYRSMADAKVGGVAAGLGNYFKIDPTIFRIIFVLGTLFTGGALAFAYLALWLLLPTAASTSSDLGGIVRDNLNEMGAKLRGVTGGSTGAASTAAPQAPNSQANSAQANGNPGGASTTPVGDYVPTQASQSQSQAPQAGVAPQHRHMGILPILLIALGIIFLMGGFHPMYMGGWGPHWFFPWPLLLIGLCFFAFRGRRYR